ncbi:hypothetical protein COV20_06415 [Candidatus Woesearchaeota archaeon CG10_big_fil_rev_8_21_14_0_10_45_16]|nr:MAG: hypothetical protein COV20_06415 [Candidatus Woesearchaeota archaeon CG10_big_fil_rev_8_21_14_0_10_45_16]
MNRQFLFGIVFFIVLMQVVIAVSPADTIDDKQYCDPVADDCPSGYSCSGPEGSFLMTKCCPVGSTYDYYLDECEGKESIKKEEPVNNLGLAPITTKPNENRVFYDKGQCSIEVCDGKDNDCDGVPDDGVDCSVQCSQCGDGFFNVCDKDECTSLGSCDYSRFAPFGRCEASTVEEMCVEEMCNGINDDCDEKIDESCYENVIDADKDGLSADVDLDDDHWDFYGMLRPGDIILVGHSGINELYDKDIPFLKRFLAYEFMVEFSHSALYLGDGKIIDSHPKNIVFNVGNKGIGGVGTRSIHDFIDNPETIDKEDGLSEKYQGYSVIAVMRVKGKEDVATKVAEEALKYEGYCFDYGFDDSIDLISYCEGKSFYCSEFVATAWEKGGVDFWREIPFIGKRFILPRDLYNSDYTELIYEEELK